MNNEISPIQHMKKKFECNSKIKLPDLDDKTFSTKITGILIRCKSFCVWFKFNIWQDNIRHNEEKCILI